jgi:uncharacterized membrane protein YqaE (UPF0057 family)
MKKIIFGFIILFVGTQLMTSCSSDSNVLSQFSKRKYMKRFKTKDVKYKDQINKRENNYASVQKVEDLNNAKATASLDVETLSLNEIEAVDNAVLVENKIVVKKHFKEGVTLKIPYTDFANSYRTNRFESVSDKALINNLNSSNVASSSGVNEVVLAILCIFIPPLAVYLHEDSITTNFWVDLIATLLFWIPGIIVAFLIVFGGVSF